MVSYTKPQHRKKEESEQHMYRYLCMYMCLWLCIVMYVWLCMLYMYG